MKTTLRSEPRRRALGAALALAGAGVLAGCAGPSPPVQWYSLRADPPVPPAAPPTVAAGDAAVWEVAGVRLPGELDRDTLVVASGAAMLQPLTGHRWAEPLRDSVPRLLARDLALLRGAGRVWPAPAPAGATVARRLRVEIAALAADADRRALRLQAQWWFVDTAPTAAGASSTPAVVSADIRLPLAPGAGIDALAAAHRLALWQLAERIAATAP